MQTVKNTIAMTKLPIAFWLIFNTIRTITAGLPGSFTYDIFEVTAGTSNPDIVDLKLEIERIGPNGFGVSGFIDIKTDLYDDVTIRITTERSIGKSGPYQPFPMGIANETLTKFMNTHYKFAIQPFIQQCFQNAPYVTNNFRAPLTKRRITMRGCQMSTNKLPSVSINGYYKSNIFVSGPFTASIVLWY